MTVCPVCNKENNDEEYCTDCGTKLVDVEKNSNFEFDKNNDITKVDELNIYMNELNEKINKQKEYLDELNNNPLIKEYETISKINDKNKKLKAEIEELKQKNKNISIELEKEQKKNSILQSENNQIKNEGTVGKIIRGIWGGNDKRNYSDAKFCPQCGYKLS